MYFVIKTKIFLKKKILTNAACGYVIGIKGPAIFTNTISFLTVRFTIGVLPTIDVFTRRFALDHRRCSDIAIFTFAAKAANCISANRIWATGLFLTFVYVNANRALGLETFLAETLVFYTFGIVCAVKIGFTKDVYINLNTKIYIMLW